MINITRDEIIDDIRAVVFHGFQVPDMLVGVLIIDGVLDSVSCMVNNTPDGTNLSVAELAYERYTDTCPVRPWALIIGENDEFSNPLILESDTQTFAEYLVSNPNTRVISSHAALIIDSYEGVFSELYAYSGNKEYEDLVAGIKAFIANS